MAFSPMPTWLSLKSLILTFLSVVIIDAKYTILSTPVQVTFDEYSAIKELRMRFMTEASFYKNDAMMISFSQPLQTPMGTTLTFSLINDFTKELATGTFVFTADATVDGTAIGQYGMRIFRSGAGSSYISEFSKATWYTGSSEIKSQWLTLIIKIPKNILHTFSSRLCSVNMAIVSSLNPQSIKYQYSNGMSYFYFAKLASVAPPQNIAATIANSIYGKSGQTGVSTTPGALYPIYLELIPNQNFKNFVLNIQFTSLTLAQVQTKTLQTKVLDFQFQGTCYFICQSTVSCINALSCTVKPDKIEVNIAELVINQKYVLRFTLLNPPYKRINKNFLIWSDGVETTYDTVNVVTSLPTTLSTTPITITILQDDLKLFWKLPHSVVRDSMGLGFFMDGGINTVQVGFHISSGSPFGQILEVQIQVGTTQIIMESIQHNLPCLNTTISYDFLSAPPRLVIKNVTALTRNTTNNFRYWVAFRARHSTAPDNAFIDRTGFTSIKLAKYPNQVLFESPATYNFVRNRIPWTNFKDIGGFHADPGSGASIFKNFDTQVISSTDNGLQNGTSEAMRKYLNEPTTVGVDASIPNQQLLFLLKSPAITAGSAADKFDTRIYYNPNVFQSVSNKGLQVVAYYSTSSKWQTKGNDCYLDQSLTPIYQTYMCQKYNDHARPIQVDNVNDSTPFFPQIPFYKFSCGQGSGVAGDRIQCLQAPNCQSQCTIFKGYSLILTQGKAGVAAIRNATFIPNYQSPIKAGVDNLDFVVAFYQNGNFISASLINAYTVSFDTLQQTTVSLINTYHDNIMRNAGERVPTILEIQGKLAVSQYVNLQSPDKMRLYLPGLSIGLDNFIINQNELGCSYNCRVNKSFTTAVSQNWLEMTSVAIENIPTMTNDFKVFLPVELKGNLMSIYVGFEVQGRLIAVYRFGGSAVKSSILGTPPNIFSIQTTRVAPFWDLASDWTTAPFSTMDYKQSINLQQTNSLDNFTIVSMALSVLPNHVKPFVTVTIRELQIIAEYTSITVGNSLHNRSCDKFNYWFKVGTVSKKIQTFICEMYTNDNTTNNNIRIDYPIFSNYLGPGFPYDQVFTYAYASDVDGSLEAIRGEADDKIKINLCRTNKATEYNVDELGRQLEIFRIQVDPILMSPSTYTKIMVIMTLPLNIVPVECSAVQAIFSQKLKCTVILPLSVNTVLQLELLDTAPIKLLDFYIYLNCKQLAGAVTLFPNQKYQVEIWLPHTTSVGNLQVIYGQLFISHKSTAYACENTFTYINAAYNKTILIPKYQLNSVALNLNTELQFTLVFSKQKSTLLKNSRIEFRFVGLQTNQQTYCYLAEFQHVFWTRKWTPGSPGVSSTYWLINDADVPSLTDNPVTVKCSNLILTDLSATKPTLSVGVYDITGIVQIMTYEDGVPPKVLTTTPYYPDTTVLSGTGVIQAKQYTTVGFNGQYTIRLNIAGNGLVQGFIDLSEYSFDPRLIGCKLNVAQDVFCKVYQLNTNTSLQYRSRFIYFKTYYITSSPTITITIYPVLQQKQVIASIIRKIIKVGSSLYYIPIVDTLALLPINDIFFINNYNIIPLSSLTSVMFNLELTYQFATPVNQPLFIQLNQILYYSSIVVGVVLKCSINATLIPCDVVQKDLVKVSAFAYTANMQYLLKIQSFEPNYQIPLRDKENFFIRAFVIDSSTKQIDYVSYLNTDLALATTLMTLIKSYQASVNKPSLIWNLTDSRGLTFLPKIYIGYYGPPIQLIVYDSSKFVSEFTVASTTYSSSGFKCEMGFTKCYLSLIAENFNSVIRKYQFLHTNAYYLQPPLLEVEVSNEQCIIALEFNNYKIFQNGMTLPIILNFTRCRPRQLVKIVTTLNSSQVKLDNSLSQLEVTPSNPIGIIFVRHQSTITTLLNYTLTLALSGTYASSFTLSQTAIIIEKIARTQSSIQGKLPEIVNVIIRLFAQLAQNQTTLRIQCNQPSTVYWAIGLYPTTLGEEGQDIQTRLLNGKIGLKTSIVDPLTYGNLQYGLTYTNIPNVWKNLNIQNLQGNSVYNFKYFCVNIKGSFSDGQIITLTTPQSTYQIVKLTLGFNTPLTFTKVNDFACAISEGLVIPYNSTKSSVNTNCKSAPLIFYTNYNNDIRDFNTSGDKPYFYNNFYIRSTTEPSQQIVSKIRDKLKNNSRILKTQIPLWEVFNMQYFSNFHSEQIQPDAITPGFEGEVRIKIFQEEISMTVPIKNQQFYVVIGLLSSYFNATSMSLPGTYMIKQGKFSQSVNFDKVFMNYTTKEITFNFQGLTSDTQYSIFYFITVDNPAINAKHSEVKYINLATLPFLTIDLWGKSLIGSAYVWVGFLLILVYFS